MMRVGCAGFSIPQTRYFQDFLLLEVQETAVRVPGPGTVGRWQREAPAGFEWTLLAPPAVLEGNANESRDFLKLARSLGARAAVIQVPSTQAPKSLRATLRKALDKLPRTKSLHWVLDPPAGLSAADRRAIAEDSIVIAVDPLEVPPLPGKVAYFRLPGPAGRLSRYEDAALSIVASRASEAEEVYAIFANADMHTDAKRLHKMVEE